MSEVNETVEEKTPDTQELLTQIAKLKRAIDKASSETAEWKKKYHSTLSEAEKASQEKAEQDSAREAEFQKLLRENNLNKVEKSYLAAGWTASEASRMATAEVDGDFDSKMKILAEVDARKAKEVMADFLRTRPDIQMGTGEGGITKDQFEKMVADSDVDGLTKFKREHPTEYAKYMK